MWDINMNSDLQAGDIVEVVYRDGSDGFPDIAAARFHSNTPRFFLPTNGFHLMIAMPAIGVWMEQRFHIA